MAAIRAQDEHSAAALEALAAAGFAVAAEATLREALSAVIAAAARASGADVALVRVLESTGADLTVRAVAAGPALAAELEGTRLAVSDVPRTVVDDVETAPRQALEAAARSGAKALLLFPVEIQGRVLGTLELHGRHAFGMEERRAGLAAAGQTALVLRAFGIDGPSELPSVQRSALELTGEALVVGVEGARTPAEVARLGAAVAGASAALLWEVDEQGLLALQAEHGIADTAAGLDGARELAARAFLSGASVEVTHDELLPAGTSAAALLLGEPPIGVLQLLFATDALPAEPELAALCTFAVRAAHALRAGAGAQALADELERTRALLSVVGQATAELSLAHTLETAVERVAELLRVDKLAVYLCEDDRLAPAADRGLTGPHVRVADRLLELALGPLRSRGILVFDSVAGAPLLKGVADAAGEAGIESVLAVPLVTQEETIGLLVVYPGASRRLAESDVALLSALAGQLAVAVQNAKLHEQAKELGEELEGALDAERQAARQLGALYEISRSFAQSLSLEATLEAVTRTVVEVLDLDAAVIGMPDERRERLEPRALHVADASLAPAVRALLERPQPFGLRPLQRLFRRRRPFRLDEPGAASLADPLRPFLARGWTGATVPIATPAEVIASLSLYSFRPGRPISDEMLASAVAIAGQAALAIDNARLYQQQKAFADTMQRSLLPRSHPQLRGLEVGDVYEPAARVEVGGDIYDFLELPDGRLAVVVGDVTGHGIEAAADMAMAKFVFRSLAREHPDPAEFLRYANDVVHDEIAPGKFITMAYVTVDPGDGSVAYAGAGHPAPRLVHPGGRVEPLAAAGLVLGVDADQEFDEARAELPKGGAVVLYTDGVVEARSAGELYGDERLDRLLAERATLPAAELAQAIVEDCRAFAGGELSDDCAIVVIRRS